MTLKVFQCAGCGATLFPARYFCPACGGAEWTDRLIERGTVTECTTVRHRVGAERGADVYLASVETTAGPIVIAQLGRTTQSGEKVILEMDDDNRIRGRPP